MGWMNEDTLAARARQSTFSTLYFLGVADCALCVDTGATVVVREQHLTKRTTFNNRDNYVTIRIYGRVVAGRLRAPDSSSGVSDQRGCQPRPHGLLYFQPCL